MATRIATQRKISQSSGRAMSAVTAIMRRRVIIGVCSTPEPRGERVAEVAREAEGDGDDEELDEVADHEHVREEPVARRIKQRQQLLGRQQLFHRSRPHIAHAAGVPAARCDGDTLAGLPRGRM